VYGKALTELFEDRIKDSVHARLCCFNFCHWEWNRSFSSMPKRSKSRASCKVNPGTTRLRQSEYWQDAAENVYCWRSGKSAVFYAGKLRCKAPALKASRWLHLRSLHSSNLCLSEENAKLTTITATLYASVGKICCVVDETIASMEQTLLILVSMKSEMAVKPQSSEHVGKIVHDFGIGIKVGGLVKPGDTLLVLRS